MDTSFRSSLIRIWTAEGEEGIIVGAGFLVGKRRVLTCAHVVAQALDISENALELPQGVIWLDFPLVSHNNRFAASVVLWKPLRPDGGGDIAGLELSSDPPIEANIAHIVAIRDVWQHPFNAFGFPRGQDSGVWVTGQLMDRQAMGWIMVEGLKTQGFAIEQGFSGTPVWDPQIQGVVGMVVAASQPVELKAAFVIPTDTLLEAWPIITVQEAEPRNPYKGLRPFKEKDAGDFFGREQLITELIEAISTQVLSKQNTIFPAKRLLALLGPSGSGKSSVIQAGVLPRLRQGELAGSAEWVYLDPVVPGQYPIEALALTLASHLPNRTLKSIREDLEDETLRGLHLLAMLIRQKGDANVILFIDQFEEIFTQVESDTQRQHFINLLLIAISEPQGALIVILAMRADFYDRPMQYPRLAQLLQMQQHLVLSMSITDLRTVIEQPASLPDVQLAFGSGLVDELLFEIQSQPGALPLLQFTLDQLFEKRHDHQLTWQAYREIGGVKGALAKHAEITYETLPSEEHQHLARALFVRLIDPGATEQDTTRRRATLAEFVLADGARTRILRVTIQVFIDARLLMTNELAGTITLEVSHEALIREWVRLGSWVREAREDIPLQQAISKDSLAWERNDKAADRLYRGNQLSEARAWAKRNTPSRQEELFLRAGMVNRRRRIIYLLCMMLTSVFIAGTIFQGIVFLRPSWCPTFLCLSPQPLLQVNSTHDSNLELAFHALQSSWYVIPGNPKSYTLANLPHRSSVQLIDKGLSQPYRVVVGLHNLQHGRFGMVIEQVTIVIKRSSPVPYYPLYAWFDSSENRNYTNNLYQVTYDGEESGRFIPASYVDREKVAPVQLLPGESDEITLEVNSHQVADVYFQVNIAYRIVNEAVVHTLTLAKVFEIAFSDKANWHPYMLKDGHFAASTSGT